jgi:predicted dehydrogenase
MKKWKVGIVGSGGIARIVHVPGWKNLANAEILAVADTRKDVAQAFAKDFGVPNAFEDYKKMLEMDELDIIDICAPNTAHFPITIASFKAGKHVICEKPLAVSPQQVEDMIAASKKAGKKLSSIQNHRFAAENQAVKKMIVKGDLGEIYYARVHALRRRLLPPAVTFTRRKISGGGPCLDIGVHMLDLACWFMGNPKVKSVTGVALTKLAKREDIHGDWGEWDRKTYDVEDFAAGYIKFDNGASMNLECSFLLNMKESEVLAVNLFGTEAGIQAKCGYPPEIYTEKNRTFMISQLVNIPQAAPHSEQIRLFVEAIEKDKIVPVPPEQSLEVIKILDGIYRSGKSGREVRF